MHFIFDKEIWKQNFRQLDRWKSTTTRSKHVETEMWKKSKTEKIRRGENADAREGREVAKHCFFSNVLWFRRVDKAVGAEPAGQMKDKKLQAVVARNTFEERTLGHVGT